MKIQISELERHIVSQGFSDAEKILQYAYDNHLTLSSAIEHLDRWGGMCIFPQGSKPSTIEWDVTDVKVTDEEIEAFCRTNNIEDVDAFVKSLRVI